MLRYAVNFEGPIAIRYPRGEAYEGLREYRKKIEYAKSEVIFEESQIAIFAVGNMVETAVEVRERLKQQGYACSLINARSVKPLDEEMLLKMAEKHTLFVTLEENICRGGYGEAVLSFLNSQDDAGTSESADTWHTGSVRGTRQCGTAEESPWSGCRNRGRYDYEENGK